MAVTGPCEVHIHDDLIPKVVVLLVNLDSADAWRHGTQGRSDQHNPPPEGALLTVLLALE